MFDLTNSGTAAHYTVPARMRTAHSVRGPAPGNTAAGAVVHSAARALPVSAEARPGHALARHRHGRVRGTVEGEAAPAFEGSIESGLADGAEGRVFTVDAVLPVAQG